ncbi:MAG: AAA family ATPase, partial [SAR324 cluster bacterium]|nr:AAA family ATPase [SAR324 cluster bacterium]
MQCPNCGRANPEGQKFCGECGNSLATLCPQCNSSNPPGQKFCGQCGHTLSPPASAGTQPAAAPPAAPPEGERRQATIVFSDLSGYTAMNQRLDPEEVEGIMSRIKAEAVNIVEGHGGIVNQFVGDEVLALFGIPTAHEDDPRRAVQAALDLHALARSVSPEVEEKIGRPLRMHTGVHTGLIVTNLRDARDGTYGITGDTVNTGARLKAQAAEDEIRISPETQRLIAPYFQTEALTAVELKGRSEVVTPYRVVGETTVETRFEASERRGLSRYVGRERELEMLRECFQQAQQGRGQVVTVVGEAGLGKTRLIYEFRTALDLSRVNQVRGRCAATGENLSYLPFVDLFKRWFRIRDSDSPAQMLEKTEGSALALDPALEEHLPALLHLLSIPSEHSFPPAMPGEAIQRKLQAALKACLLAGCKDRPLVMVFEDLHWVDGNSEAMLQQYIEALPAQPALLVLSYRPEYRPRWGHYSHLTPLVLKPLAEGATAAIVASALKVESLPEGLAAVVHARTEGNPFFSEEVTLSLEEEG